MNNWCQALLTDRQIQLLDDEWPGVFDDVPPGDIDLDLCPGLFDEIPAVDGDTDISCPGLFREGHFDEVEDKDIG